MIEFLSQMITPFRRITARRVKSPPAAHRSLVYALCEEYDRRELWAAYSAFRLDPRSRTWRRLRRHHVPWQRAQTVESLLQRVCPLSARRTPDPSIVGFALTSASTVSSRPQRGAHHR